MPLPGGAADKLGNRYELWWTVWQLVRMLDGRADSIRIEDPGVTKAEFVMSHDRGRELHQAKRSHQGGNWSLASLAGPDMRLLQAVHAQLAGNDYRFVFVSTSDARELAELAERSRQAESLKEFEEQFLASKEIKENFKKIQKYWSNANAATAFDILRRVEVRTMDERSIEEHVTWGLRALFLSDPVSLCNELRALAENSVHKTLTRDDLVDHIVTRGYTLRRLTRPDAASALIYEVTERYLVGVRKKLIRKTLLPREATQLLLTRMAEATRGGDFVLTGKAGSGKTACAIEFVDALRSHDISVLSFRLDRLEPVSSTTELGKQLGLEESPTLVLAAEGREAVLVIDQLDAVSTTSGRNADFLDAVEGMLAEAQGLRERVKLHIVVVCRAFDWENDHRLRQMLSKNHARVKVAEFSPEEVRMVLSADHFDIELFSSRQLELLRLPQNLSLFLDAGFAPTSTPAFNTAKELFDRYWDTKRRAVASRTVPLPEQWAEVIRLLCDEMAHTQQLSVPREKLDHFAPDYVGQMASEGVITFDGRRYGFGHESFFDYCFARSFVAREGDLTTSLTTAEQHLFRRAQVRQVLAYLRDLDRTRYCKEVNFLLSDGRIRMHLKDLTLALLANVTDPGDDEWTLLNPWLKSIWAAFARGGRSPDKFASLVWNHVFGSKSWFSLIDRLGFIAAWLASGNSGLTNMAVNYLRSHQRHAGDRVAELLEPYAGQGGEWKDRLRSIMEWANHENSRRFFELFLRLIDDGTLDQARGPIAVNSTFWSMLYGLTEARPDWIPEVAAHWLRRRVAVLRQEQPDGQEMQWRNLFNRDEFGPKCLHEAADKHPEVFAQHVLPVVLEISDAAINSNETGQPHRDAVWPLLFKSEHHSMEAAYLNALATALEKLAKGNPELAKDYIELLKPRSSFTANYLLLSLYTAAAESFADEAADVLCKQSWRLYCGYSDSPYWVAMALIHKIAPACSPENLARLEVTLLYYSSDYEKTVHGYRSVGHSCFTLLSALPENLRSKNARSRFLELERKFGKPDAAPQGIQWHSVGSPIKKEAGEKMTDEQWLRAIAKYRKEERLDRWEHPEKGGARELAGMLREFVRKEPERFARLSLQFPLETSPTYIERVLEGLKDTIAPTTLKLDVCRKAFAELRVECGTAIADLLGSIEELLPDEAVEMLHWLATEHPEPEKELWEEKAPSGQPYYRGDILTHGINTTCGRAAEAIRDLIITDGCYVTRFRGTISRLVADPSLGVRSCVASTLLAVAPHNPQLAVELFPTLVVGDDRLLATPHVERFISYGLREHFLLLRSVVERMLRSTNPDVSRAGARLASLAALYHPTADDLVNEAMNGHASQRCGIAEVTATNVAQAECRVWCKQYLLRLFNDSDAEVRGAAATCFRRLSQEPLEDYEDLIVAFCDSLAYQEDSFSILHTLEESVGRLPGITCVVCEKFLTRFSDEARDISTRRAGDVHQVVTLIFRTYHQHQRDEWASKCLDLIDLMCLEGIQDVSRGLEEFER